MFHGISEGDLDALKEVSNVGAGHAVTVVFQPSNRKHRDANPDALLFREWLRFRQLRNLPL